METSDWISNSIAALALVATIALTIWTNWKSSKTSEHQQALAEAQHRTNSMLAEWLADARQAHEAQSSAELDSATSTHATPDVRWMPEHVRKNTWLLRNLGTGTAVSVNIDKAAVGGARVDFSPPLPADIGPGESLKILAISAWGHPVSDEVTVTWGTDESEIVPLPQWQ